MTLPLVFFINFAISINLYAPGITAKIRVSDHVSPWVSYKNSLFLLFTLNTEFKQII